ncbi:carbamoyltransferase C-terminal domain-containing protein [Microcoleus sp. B5-C4]|uniref:carbamoyltransferase C-terminal domain-containing protein n=1 Tax=Microcoleus sp. B5-C4 TaxID=2818675 RepID=UPI002FD02A95
MGIFLGLAGWPQWGHDSAACLVVDGKVIAATEEERFSRIRHAPGATPIEAVKYCLSEGRLKLSDIDGIGIGWNGLERYKTRHLSVPQKDDVLEAFFPSNIFGVLDSKLRQKTFFLDHHLCHAYSAIWSWPNYGENCAVLVIDGQGDYASGAEMLWKDGILKLLLEHPPEHSLGYMFEACCSYVGFNYHHAGKLMALAAFGSSEDIRPMYIQEGEIIIPFKGIQFGKDIYPHEAKEIVDRHWLPWFQNSGQKLSYKQVEISGLGFKPEHLRAAAATQAALEEVVEFYLKRLKISTGLNNVCIAGGVALNCVNNRRIIESSIFEQVSFIPAANDAGTALGAALLLAHQAGDKIAVPKMPYWGVSFDKSNVEQELQKTGIVYHSTDDPEQTVASALSNGQIVGIFSGRSEFGPRALGNRSILAPPVTGMRQKLNRLKGRESWRPFGIVLCEAGRALLQTKEKLPHMLVNAVATDKKVLAAYPAAFHVDGTTRPQIVGFMDNEKLARIAELAYAIGLECFINTSFNLAGSPIINTPKEAIDAFVASEIDTLVIENYVVNK